MTDKPMLFTYSSTEDTNRDDPEPTQYCYHHLEMYGEYNRMAKEAGKRQSRDVAETYKQTDTHTHTYAHTDTHTHAASGIRTHACTNTNKHRKTKTQASTHTHRNRAAQTHTASGRMHGGREVHAAMIIPVVVCQRKGSRLGPADDSCLPWWPPVFPSLHARWHPPTHTTTQRKRMTPTNNEVRRALKAATQAREWGHLLSHLAKAD